MRNTIKVFRTILRYAYDIDVLLLKPNSNDPRVARQFIKEFKVSRFKLKLQIDFLLRYNPLYVDVQTDIVALDALGPSKEGRNVDLRDIVTYDRYNEDRLRRKQQAYTILDIVKQEPNTKEYTDAQI